MRSSSQSSSGDPFEPWINPRLAKTKSSGVSVAAVGLILPSLYPRKHRWNAVSTVCYEHQL
ncbi:hypothetical protein NQ317_006969 [Molorchus minor]|uniref:Uncharacterized protein n=1 Tax=Molorchus minor TaxID=1323400 RepID=A0ABQ9JK77_9CUCU|nr:hypothetical protein NQ317_006969 [Molorchus minor]